jgi:lysine-N-methylase
VKLDAFLSKHPYVMNHYFKNHIYKSLFPFSEGKNVKEATLLLMSRYMIINRELCGLAARREPFGMEDVVAYLQAFSKVIEHHKHFEEKTIQVLKNEGYKLEQLMHLIACQ